MPRRLGPAAYPEGIPGQVPVPGSRFTYANSSPTEGSSNVSLSKSPWASSLLQHG